MKKIYEKPELNINVLTSSNVFATSGTGQLQGGIYNDNDEVVEWGEFFD